MGPADGQGGAEVPTSATDYAWVWDFDEDGIDRTKLQFWETLGAGGTPAHGTLSVVVTRINSGTCGNR